MANINEIGKKIAKVDEQMAELEEKRRKLQEEEKQAVCAQLQVVIDRKNIPPERLMLLRYASKEQLNELLDSIEEEREKPAKEKSDAGSFVSKKNSGSESDEKENKENA